MFADQSLRAPVDGGGKRRCTSGERWGHRAGVHTWSTGGSRQSPTAWRVVHSNPQMGVDSGLGGEYRAVAAYSSGVPEAQCDWEWLRMRAVSSVTWL